MTDISTLLHQHPQYPHLLEPIKAGNFTLDIQIHWRSPFHKETLYELCTYGKENKIPPTIIYDMGLIEDDIAENENIQLISQITIKQLQIIYDGCIAYSNTNFSTFLTKKSLVDFIVLLQAKQMHENDLLIHEALITHTTDENHKLQDLVVFHWIACGLRKKGI
jgi:hypothetical protein